MAALPVGKQALAPSAVWLLNLCGCRMLWLNGHCVVGIWRDLDSPELRAALASTVQAMPVIYLDHAEIPFEYRTRNSPVRDPGEPFSAWLERAEAEAQRRWDAWEQQCRA